MYDILLCLGLIVLCGAAFKYFKVGGVDTDVIRYGLSMTVLHVFLPALCIDTFYGTKLDMETVLVPFAAWIGLGVGLGVAYVLYQVFGRYLNLEAKEKGALIIGAAFGNVTFLGLPVLTEVFGTGGQKYALYFDMLAASPALWIFGVAIASVYGQGQRVFNLRQSIRTVAMLPPLWAIGIGVALQMSGVRVPGVVLKSLHLLGVVVVPLMIFSIGLSLSLPGVRYMWAVLPAVVVKLVLVPGAVYLAAVGVGLSGVALSASVLEGAMPTMVASLLIAERFDLDRKMSAFLIVLTTALSFVTLPFVYSLVGGR